MSIARACLPYRKTDHFLAYKSLFLTLLCYFASLVAAIWLAPNWVLATPFMIFCGMMAVRLYMVQHDCMHRSFVRGKVLNDVIGVLLAPFTLTSFYAGRHNHGLHHTHVSDLDRRDTFEINVMTVAEYNAAPLWKRLGYQLYRSPFTLLIVGPFLVYGLLHRFPKNTIKAGLIWDVLLHNILLVGFFALVYAFAGWTGVLVLTVSVYFGVSYGAFIPYVEHNFEDIQWGRKPDLTFEEASLNGSSVLDFGDFYHLLTANIGYHDLHHLNPKIPSYFLKDCHEALEEQGLITSRKISLREGFSCLRWKLWDEDREKMVTFADAKRAAIATAPIHQAS